MTTLCDEIVQEGTKQTSAALERFMDEVGREKGIVILDNSVQASFVARRFLREVGPEIDDRSIPPLDDLMDGSEYEGNRNAGLNEYHGHTVAEMWEIERANMYDLVAHIAKLKHPVFVKPSDKEFKVGIRGMKKLVNVPYRALCFKWGRGEIAGLEPDVDEQARQEAYRALARFIVGAKSYRELLGFHTTNHYMDDYLKTHVGKVMKTTRSFVTHSTGRYENKFNDADTLAEGHALSFVMPEPVTIGTLDRGFLRLHEILYKHEEKFARDYKFRPSSGSVRVVWSNGEDIEVQDSLSYKS